MHISLCVVPFFIKTLSSNTLVFSVYIEIFIICRDCSTFIFIYTFSWNFSFMQFLFLFLVRSFPCEIKQAKPHWL